MASTCTTANLLLLTMVVVVATADYYAPPGPPQPYVPKPTTTYTSPVKTPYLPKPNPDMAIEGFILCKSGYKTYPIQGAKVKVVCPIVDSHGKLVAKVKNISSCKVKLESSPVYTCKTPTNVNKGVTGAPLSPENSKFLSHDNLTLYTLEPFYFSSPVAPKPVY
ncbi:unnamed protein product [Arabidopsis arenosa]|uniref:Pollen Ole e 1 allergen and extensin family protein n=1 Tax=Arabidopsis arenosa TaxID=38785 RepID=A0A8S2A9S8_ARAAE|nr:unnamed protein product [Arabidopsis arenosa]